MRRVVVTGLGVVAPNGVGKEAFWSACLNGRSGVGPIRSFDATGHPVKIAAEVQDFNVSPYLPHSQRKSVKIMSRAMRFAVGAAGLGIIDAGLEMDWEDPERVGVVMGTGMVPIDLPELMPHLVQACDANGQLETRRLGQCGASALFPLWILKYLPNMVAAHISMAFNAQGPNNTIATACAAGTQAVGEGFRLIARDDADIVLAGGADSRIDPLLMLGLHRPGSAEPFGPASVRGVAALRRQARRLRPGRRRGRPGSGRTGACQKAWGDDLRRSPGPGEQLRRLRRHQARPGGARRCPRHQPAPCKEARVDPRDVDYINAHGTSTRLNDLMETMAVNESSAKERKALPLSSIKSMVGHLIGAAGAVEAVALALTLQSGVLPPTINQTQPDPDCDLDYVPNTAREMPHAHRPFPPASASAARTRPW